MSNKLTHSPANTKRILYFGLLIILGIMAVLSFTTITILNSAEDRIQTIVQDHNEKTQFIVSMRTAARERTISLKKMLILRNPLEVSEEMENFTLIASDFLNAREKLLAKKQTPQEEQLINKLFKLVAKNGKLQLDTARLIENEEYNEARLKLLNEVIPIQDTVFDFMSEMIEIQKKATQEAIDEGKKESSRVIRFLLSFGLATILITAVISYYIIHYITNSAKIITHEKERAQTTLHSIGDAVITTDERGHIEHANDAAEEMFGVAGRIMTGNSIETFITFIKEGSQELQEYPIDEVLKNKQVVTSSGDSILVTRLGQKYGVEYTASPIYDRNNDLTGTVLVIKDVSQIRVLSNELAYHARHDNLTGLLN